MFEMNYVNRLTVCIDGVEPLVFPKMHSLERIGNYVRIFYNCGDFRALSILEDTFLMIVIVRVDGEEPFICSKMHSVVCEGNFLRISIKGYGVKVLPIPDTLTIDIRKRQE